MKTTLILLSLLAYTASVKAQSKWLNPYQIKFASTYCFSGAGYQKESHIIIFNPGLTDQSCDTLLIDNQKYFVLDDGYTGEQVSKGKYNWSRNIYGVLDVRNGRMIGPNSIDRDLKCFMFVGNDMLSKKPNKIYFYNHGMSVTYY